MRQFNYFLENRVMIYIVTMGNRLNVPLADSSVMVD